VKEGDTVEGLVDRLLTANGNDQVIQKENCLDVDSDLDTGDLVKVPFADPQRDDGTAASKYIVRHKDNIYELAMAIRALKGYSEERLRNRQAERRRMDETGHLNSTP
jgi:hypothetical protein